jgi:hypothetical protein
MDRRQNPRKPTDPVHVAALKIVDQPTVLAHSGTILNASATGLLIRINRNALSAEGFAALTSLTPGENQHVVMHIVEMTLDIDGRIVRAYQPAPECYEIAIDFTDNAPEYWRECLAELLPGRGELLPTYATVTTTETRP